MRQNQNGVSYDLARGVTLAIAKPPFTVERLKAILNHFEYYRLTDKICLEKIKQYENKDDMQYYVAFCKNHIKTNAERRNNVLRLFDYCETDFDRELLKRRFIDRQVYFDIAYDLAYSDRSIFKKLKKALECLSENTKDIQEFEF